ncbi:glycosyl transferase family 2 [Clostridium sp. MF28]|nr:glycosyl transferase family 2 [Clostridium sp. MF28]PSM56105.1 glycosyl transferase family 2 [Clostridium diolis]
MSPEHDILEVKNKKKLVFFVKKGMDSFLGDIISRLSDEYEIKKMIIEDYKKIDEGLEWADICWFEWCDELLDYGSKHKLSESKIIICRLHSYEAFVGYPNMVKWESVDKIIFVGENIKKFVMEKYKIDESKTVLIPNGVNIDEYTFKERKSGFNIAYVGYINYKKGPMLLLHTFKAIYDKDHRYKLYIAGQFQDDRDVLYFQQMIKEFGIEKNVCYEGWQDNLDKWLEDKNYILCTSVLESQNMSVMQAMAKGIKPIIHNFVGAKDIYDNKYIWNTIDEAMKMIFSSEYNSKEYRLFVEKNYSINKEINKIKSNIKMWISEKNNINTERPLVTVGITNYNYSKYLDECINSVLNQTYENIEILIIDDCSTDDSIEKIKSYTKNYKNIRAIFHGKNSGSVIQSYREVIKYSQGEYFQFINSDDLYSNNRAIEETIQVFINNLEVDYVYTDLRIVDENLKLIDIWRYKQYTDNEIINLVFNRGGSGVMPMIGMYRTSFYRSRNIEWYHEVENESAGDTLNTLFNIKQGWKYKYLDKDLYSYRQHGESLTYDLKKRIKSIISVLEYIINNFDENIYLENYKFKSISNNEKEKLKNYTIGKFYLNLFKYYHEGKWKPPYGEISFNKEVLSGLLDPLLKKVERYILKVNGYYDCSNILNELKVYSKKIYINSDNEDEYIYSYSLNKRKVMLDKYKDSHIGKKYNVLIYSPNNGAWKYSFISWKKAFEHMGMSVTIIYDIDKNYNYSNNDIFISIANKAHFEKISMNLSILSIRNKIGIASKEIYYNDKNSLEDEAMLELLIETKFFDFLISSFSEVGIDYIFNKWINKGIKIYSVPFSFNPLIHYPEKKTKLYDYFFVGTNSYLKVDETKKYLMPIVNNFNGMLCGTGWGANVKELDPMTVRNYYNGAKINLNFHLQIQKDIENEINERTYIIAACGGFQLVDNPKILNKFYNSNELAVAYDEKDYYNKFIYYLNNQKEREEMAFNSLVKTYDNDYSIFNRINSILQKCVF